MAMYSTRTYSGTSATTSAITDYAITNGYYNPYRIEPIYHLGYGESKPAKPAKPKKLSFEAKLQKEIDTWLSDFD